MNPFLVINDAFNPVLYEDFKRSKHVLFCRIKDVIDCEIPALDLSKHPLRAQAESDVAAREALAKLDANNVSVPTRFFASSLETIALKDNALTTLLNDGSSYRNISIRKQGPYLMWSFTKINLVKEDCRRLGNHTHYASSAAQPTHLIPNGPAAMPLGGFDDGIFKCRIEAHSHSVIYEIQGSQPQQIMFTGVSQIINVNRKSETEILVTVAREDNVISTWLVDVVSTEFQVKEILVDGLPVQPCSILGNTIAINYSEGNLNRIELHDSWDYVTLEDKIVYNGEYADLAKIKADNIQKSIERRTRANASVVASEDEALTQQFFSDAPCFFEGCEELRLQFKTAVDSAQNEGCTNCELNSIKAQFSAKALQAIRKK